MLYKIKLLELSSGTKYVGTVAEQLGYEVTSLDLNNDDINCDIMNWNYTVYESGHFDVIWASPPCTEYSCAKTVGVRSISFRSTFKIWGGNHEIACKPSLPLTHCPHCLTVHILTCQREFKSLQVSLPRLCHSCVLDQLIVDDKN